MYTLTGECIFDFVIKGTIRFPVSNLEAGMYILKITGRDQELRGKVIVK
jgi:hypothetical protein